MSDSPLDDKMVEVLARLAVMSEQEDRTRQDIGAQSARIERVSDAIDDLDRRFTIFSVRQAERQARTESDVQQNYGFIRENWATLANLSGTIMVLTKVAGLW